MSSPEPTAPPAPPRCYAHPDRLAGSICRRCNRPICPDCMREAPVGWQCAGCVKQGARISPTVRWRPRSSGRLGNTRMTPVVLTLIIINAGIYLWEQIKLNHNIERFGLQPVSIHYQHQWYRLVTSPFLHASIEHIFLNMLTLAIVGPPVEAEVGKLRFLGIYLAAALGGSVCSYLLGPLGEYGVGASGAIFGVMGAYFVLARRNRWDTSTIGALIVINLVISFATPNIDWRAHVGGLLTGAAVGYGMARTMERRRPPALSAAYGTAVFVAAVVPLILLSFLPPGKV